MIKIAPIVKQKNSLGANSDSYNMLFSWMVQDPTMAATNNKISLFSRAIEVWWDDHEVTTPLLKFMSEFAYNKVRSSCR